MPATKIEGECTICEQASAKYRCPQWFITYCSLPCFKLHKDTTCKSPETDRDVPEVQVKTEPAEDFASVFNKPNVPLADGEAETDYVTPEILDKLTTSSELKSRLANRHLRDLIRTIDAAEEPSRLLSEAMQTPVFTEFVDECLRVVEPKS